MSIFMAGRAQLAPYPADLEAGNEANGAKEP